MAKMYFGKTVRYEGTEYPPNTTFEVKDTDVNDLKKSGGWLVEAPKEIDDDKEPENDKEEKSELDILREKALELGIDFKGNWGVKKLTEAITEAEQA
jgi:hypothetical protein